MKTRYLCLGTGVAALLVAPAFADSHDEDEIPWEVAEVFFELNNTDGDLGIHSLVDGGPWKRLQIEDTGFELDSASRSQFDALLAGSGGLLRALRLAGTIAPIVALVYPHAKAAWWVKIVDLAG